MAIINIDTTLDVVEKQKELAAALMDEDSIYIRMKETLVDLLEKGEIKGTALANGALELQFATQQFHQAGGDRQPQAHVETGRIQGQR